MTKYRKLIAALVGLAVLAAGHYGLDLSGQEQMIVDLFLSLGTAFGVYQSTNTV